MYTYICKKVARCKLISGLLSIKNTMIHLNPFFVYLFIEIAKVSKLLSLPSMYDRVNTKTLVKIYFFIFIRATVEVYKVFNGL